jgi:hypothetical protein
MSTLVKLGIRANIICIIGMIIAAFAVYVFNLGGWKIGGFNVFSILVFLTFAALIISLLQNLILKPVFSGQSARLAKQAVMLAGDGEMSAGQISFVNSVIDAKNRHEKIRYISAAIIGVVVYFILGANVGSPVAEFVTLAVLLLGPTIIGLLSLGSFTKMRILDSELFDSAMQLYSSVHKANFNASLIE